MGLIEKLSPQIKRMEIGETPTVVVDDHNAAFVHWQNLDVEDAVLFHVDAHNDMNRGAPNPGSANEEYWRELNIGNFILPAAYRGWIQSIYWLNPHSTERRLQIFEIDSHHKGRIPKRHVRPALDLLGKKLVWKTNSLYLNPKNGWGHLHRDKGVKRPDAPLILDIDLDAFACALEPHYPDERRSYHPIRGWEKRMEIAYEALQGLQKPALITIARSQRTGPYAPRNLVDKVQENTIGMLKNMYG